MLKSYSYSCFNHLESWLSGFLTFLSERSTVHPNFLGGWCPLDVAQMEYDVVGLTECTTVLSGR